MNALSLSVFALCLVVMFGLAGALVIHTEAQEEAVASAGEMCERAGGVYVANHRLSYSCVQRRSQN